MIYNREYFKENIMNNRIEIDKLIPLKKKYDRLTELLTYEEVLLDKKLFLNFEKQQISLRPIISRFNEYLKLKQHLSEVNEILNDSEEEQLDFLQEKEKTENELKVLELELIREFNNYNATIQNCIVEVVSNKVEFVEFVIGAYIKFCEINDINCSCVDNQLNISGLNAKNIFGSAIGAHCGKFLNGESQLQVFIFDTPEENIFNEKDVEITACRSSGAGGQHVNTTDSAIKATHIPTGISCICQDERSQFQNKQKALITLREKVETFYKSQIDKSFDSQRKKQLKEMKINKFVRIYDEKNAVVIMNDDNLPLKEFLQGQFI